MSINHFNDTKNGRGNSHFRQPVRFVGACWMQLVDGKIIELRPDAEHSAEDVSGGCLRHAVDPELCTRSGLDIRGLGTNARGLTSAAARNTFQLITTLLRRIYL